MRYLKLGFFSITSYEIVLKLKFHLAKFHSCQILLILLCFTFKKMNINKFFEKKKEEI